MCTDSFKEHLQELFFNFFDILQKSDSNALEERGKAYGGFMCGVYFELLDDLEKKLVELDHAKNIKIV